jgi:hypothetical protein
MLARRLLLLAAVLMLLTAVAASIAPRDLTSGNDDAATKPPALPAGGTITEEIAATGSNSRIAVSRGDTLQLQVTGDVLDSVLIERMDRVDGIEPTTPARFDLLIDSPAGSYPIRLVDEDRRIGSIVVTD